MRRTWTANDRNRAWLPRPQFFYDPSPEFGANPTPLVMMMVAGFVIGVAGHVVRSRSTVALGIGLIFLARFVLPLLLNIARG